MDTLDILNDLSEENEGLKLEIRRLRAIVYQMAVTNKWYEV